MEGGPFWMNKTIIILNYVIKLECCEFYHKVYVKKVYAIQWVYMCIIIDRNNFYEEHHYENSVASITFT